MVCERDNLGSLRSLRKLARVYGVRLFVAFESWGELIPRVESFRRENLTKPEIKDDPEFQPEANVEDMSGRVASLLKAIVSQPARLAEEILQMDVKSGPKVVTPSDKS